MRYGTLMRSAVAALTVGLAAPAPAHAQLGKLLKKAKSKLTKTDTAAAKTPAGQQGFPMPTFDATIIELTPTVLDRVMRGMTAEVAELRRTASARRVLNDSIVAVSKALDQLRNAHDGSEQQQWQDAYSQVDNCTSNALEKLLQEHTPELRERMMSDRSVMQKSTELSRQIAAASQTGDTVKVHTLMARMLALQNPFIQQDSASARKQCGALPSKPAWLAQEDVLTQRQSDLLQRINAIESRAASLALAATDDGQAPGVSFRTTRTRSFYFYSAALVTRARAVPRRSGRADRFIPARRAVPRTSALTPEQYARAMERIDLYLSAASKRTSSLGPAGPRFAPGSGTLPASTGGVLHLASYALTHAGPIAPGRFHSGLLNSGGVAFGPAFSPTELKALQARAPKLRQLMDDLRSAGVTCKGWGCDALTR